MRLSEEELADFGEVVVGIEMSGLCKVFEQLWSALFHFAM